jgi:nicotinate-nucleotide adenylyltransferase
MKEEVGFFGGSFDPIHFGHINLAIEIKEKLNLKKILFCPTSISPFKVKNPNKANNNERFEMVKIAIKDINDFEIIDFEIKKQEVSYTINTLEFLKNKYNLRLILTEEALSTFHLWKEYKQILKIAPLIVGTREKNLTEFRSENFILNSNNFVKTNILEISSTDIRERLKKKKYAGHLVPKEVLDYIYNRELYL